MLGTSLIRWDKRTFRLLHPATTLFMPSLSRMDIDRPPHHHSWVSKLYRAYPWSWILYKLTGPLIRFALDALIDLRKEKERKEIGEGIRMISAGAREGTIMRDLNVVRKIFLWRWFDEPSKSPPVKYIVFIISRLPADITSISRRDSPTFMRPMNHLWLSRTTLMNRKKIMTLKHDLFLFPNSLFAWQPKTRFLSWRQTWREGTVINSRIVTDRLSRRSKVRA